MEKEIMNCDKLTKCYHKKAVLENVSLNIKSGSIVGLVGENGAGKTSLIRILAGLSLSSSGKFSFFGKPLGKDVLISLKKIGFMLNNNTLYKNWSVLKNIYFLQLLHSGNKNKEGAMRLLNLVGLDAQKDKKVGKLSYGMQQRLSLAMALANNPEFVILDEPVNGLDPMGIIMLRNIIKKLNQDNGITFFISSHNLGELEQVATHYAFLNKGHLVKVISSYELKQNLRRGVRITVDNIPYAVSVLKQSLIKYSIRKKENFIEIIGDNIKTDMIIKCLSKAGISILEITIFSERMEDYYSRIILEETVNG